MNSRDRTPPAFLFATTLAMATLVCARLAAGVPVAATVALDGGGAQLEASLRAALAPLGMTVTVGSTSRAQATISEPEDPGPRPEVERAPVWATVTVTPDPSGGATLSVAEPGTGRVMERRLRESPPFAPADAASIALMARTMLVALHAPSNPEPSETTPHATETWPAGPAGSRFGAEVGAGARLLQRDGITAALAASFSYDRANLGAALSFLVSPARAVSGAGFAGRLRDDAVALTLRLPFRAGPRFVIAPHAGLALHWARLSGTALAEAESGVSEHDLDPALRVGGRLSAAMTRHLVVAVWADADWLLRRQRYLFGQQRVAAVSRFQGVLGLTLGLRLP